MKIDKDKFNAILKEVLIKNNLGWLHTRERVEYKIDSGTISITQQDLDDAIFEYNKNVQYEV